jgi:hypothetical protein
VEGIACFFCLYDFVNGSCLNLTVLDSGKSALAATVGIDSDFPYVKIVSYLTYIVDIISFYIPGITASSTVTSVYYLIFVFYLWLGFSRSNDWSP